MSETPPTPDPIPTPDPVPTPTPMMSLGSGPSQDEKTQAMLSWFLSIVTGFIAPLIFFLMANDKPFLKRHAAMALGLQIAAFVGYIISGFLMIILIGVVTYIAVGIFVLVVCIMGGLAANKGDDYDVPVVGKMIANMFKL